MLSCEPLEVSEALPLDTVMPAGLASALSVKLKPAASATARRTSESRRNILPKTGQNNFVFITN